MLIYPPYNSSLVPPTLRECRKCRQCRRDLARRGPVWPVKLHANRRAWSRNVALGTGYPASTGCRACPKPNPIPKIKFEPSPSLTDFAWVRCGSRVKRTKKIHTDAPVHTDGIGPKAQPCRWCTGNGPRHSGGHLCRPAGGQGRGRWPRSGRASMCHCSMFLAVTHNDDRTLIMIELSPKRCLLPGGWIV